MSCQDKHCWHHQGYSLTVDPPITPEICCHCGETRLRQSVAPPSGHGPFVPHGSFQNVLADCNAQEKP